ERATRCRPLLSVLLPASTVPASVLDPRKGLETDACVSLVSRYVFRECVGALAVVLGVLFLILLSNQLAEVLGDAAAGSLPREAVFPILGLTSLSYVTLLAPIGLFLGIMLALARLSRDSEMVALAACGGGPPRLLRPVGLLTLLLAAAMSWAAAARGRDELAGAGRDARRKPQDRADQARGTGGAVDLGDRGGEVREPRLGQHRRLRAGGGRRPARRRVRAAAHRRAGRHRRRR